MAVFRWGHPWIEFQDLEREVDRLLQSVNLTFNSLRFGRQYPPLNLYELEEKYLLTAELPGVKAEDLELTISSGILTLKGFRETPADVPDDKFRRRERFKGQWQRSVSLPERVNEEELKAEFLHGLLTIHLPKARSTPMRQIPISEGNE